MSTFPLVGYLPMSGTSMAAPHVAGALGLLYGVEPQLNSTRAIRKLLQTARPNAALRGKVQNERMLDLGRLLQ
jgi:subtilisin family serine protease